jgi:pre-mRNA branch site protein p14
MQGGMGGGGGGGMMAGRRNVKLPPEVNRVLYVRNLPYKITNEEMYDIFGKYGPIRQIRKGNSQDTKGTAFVVFDDIFDAKSAVDHLSGFNVAGRYLVVLYYQARKFQEKIDTEKARAEIDELKERYNIK